MADKRIHELATTTDKSGKFIAVDEAGLSEALKFSADSLIDKAFTDTLYVKLAGDEDVNGVKTWLNNGEFAAGITVTAGGIDVTGNSNFVDRLGVGHALTPETTLHIIGTSTTPVIIDSSNAKAYIQFRSAGVIKGYFGYTDTGSQGLGFHNNSATLKVLITNEGKMGINDSAPAQLLTVQGAVYQHNGTYGITLSNEILAFSRNNANYIKCDTAAGYFALITNGRASSEAEANLVLLADGNSYFNNSLGIGTTTAQEQFEVSAVDDTTIQIESTKNGTWVADQILGGLSFYGNDASATGPGVKGYIRSTAQDTSGAAFHMEFGVHSGATLETKMKLSAQGNLGIGDNAPSTALSVFSKFKVSSDGITKWGASANQGILTWDAGKAIVGSMSGQSLVFSTNHDSGLSAKMTILTSGNVGIGTITPLVPMHINGSGNALARFQSTDRYSLIEIQDNLSAFSIVVDGATNQLRITDALDAGGSNILTIDGTNNRVGINAVAPSYSLDVTGDFRVTSTATFNASIVCNQHIYQGDNDFHYWGASNDGGIMHTGDDFYMLSYKHGGRIILQGENLAGTNRNLFEADPDGGTRLFWAGVENLATISTGVSVTGFLGVGTTDPDNVFHVHGDTNANILIYGGSGNSLIASVNDANSGYVPMLLYASEFNFLNGIAGIGISTPAYMLDVKTIGTTEARAARFWNTYDSKSGGGVIIRCGLTVPSTTPGVVALEFQDQDGDQVGNINWTSSSGVILYSAISSKKFKKNIKASKIKGIESLKAVKPRNYIFKGRTPAEEEIVKERGEDKLAVEGYIIEELEAVIPDAVAEFTGENGKKVKGYADTALIKYLHKAILELETRLAALETP